MREISLERPIESCSTVAKQRRQQIDDAPRYQAIVDGERERGGVVVL